MGTFRTKPNYALERRKKGQAPLGMQMYTHDADLIEICGIVGFDYVMIDMEHNRCNPETMVTLIRTCDACDMAPYVRVEENNPARIRSAVEAGAKGIVVPHIKNSADAREAVRASHYAPEGYCGICPSVRHNAFNTSKDYIGYHKWINENLSTIVLFEDMSALEDAEGILGELKPGRDAIGFGLADLAFSLLKPGEQSGMAPPPILMEYMPKIKKMCKERGIDIQGMVMGPPNEENTKRTIEEGTTILLFMPEQELFANCCQEIYTAARPYTDINPK